MRSVILVLLTLLLIRPGVLFARERPIDTAQSKLTIFVGKTGVFSVAGHEHQVSAPVEEGAIDDSSAGHMWFRVSASRMTVLPEKDQQAVQITMQDSVLESAKFPEIRFESTSIQKVANGRWRVTGNLALHGETNSITVDVHDNAGTYVGQAKFKQTQFGIQPVSVAGGTVKVKDELNVEFVIVVAK